MYRDSSLLNAKTSYMLNLSHVVSPDFGNFQTARRMLNDRVHDDLLS